MSRFHKSREAFEADNLLSAGKPGDILTTAEVSRRLGVPCGDSTCVGWRVFSGRIRYVEKITGLCWRWDRHMKHWKCLSDAEKPADMNGRVRRMQSHARRNERILNTIDLASLDEDSRKAAVVLGSISSIVRMTSSKKAVETLRMFANDTPQIPDESVLMRLFLNK